MADRPDQQRRVRHDPGIGHDAAHGLRGADAEGCVIFENPVNLGNSFQRQEGAVVGSAFSPQPDQQVGAPGNDHRFRVTFPELKEFLQT